MPDFSNLESAIASLSQDVEFKEKVFENLLLNEAIETSFTLVPNMQNGMLTPTFEVGANVKPFNTTIASTDSQEIGAKTFTLFPNKIEEEVNPQKYYAWYQKMGMNGTFDPNSFPLENYIVERLVDRNAEQIRNTELWSAVRNGAGTGSGDILDGFKKIIEDAITATTLPASYIATTTGTPTSANIIDAVDEVVLLLTPQYRKQADCQVLVSETLFYWYWEAYKAANNGNKPERNAAGNIILEKYGNVLLKSEISMSNAASKRIIATPQSNLQVGTNMSNFKDYVFKTHSRGWLFDILMYFEMACGVYELGKGAIAVNEDE